MYWKLGVSILSSTGSTTRFILCLAEALDLTMALLPCADFDAPWDSGGFRTYRLGARSRSITFHPPAFIVHTRAYRLSNS
jgi:hypothetical protein